MKDDGKFYGHLVYFTAIWYIFGHLVYFEVILVYFSVLVCCTDKNLANLAAEAGFTSHTTNFLDDKKLGKKSPRIFVAKDWTSEGR
jgi:hypothetical protein